MEKLQIEQGRNEYRIERYLAGQDPVESKQVYRDVAKRIKNLVEKYDQTPIFLYLRRIAHNLQLQAHS